MQKLFKNLSLLSLSLLFFIAINGCDKSTDPGVLGEATIKGTVTDLASGNPIGNVTITTNPDIGTKVTGTDGYYEFTQVPSGTYNFTFSKPGYNTITVPKTTNGKDTILLNANLSLSDVRIYNNLIVYEFFNDSSLSGVNLYDGLVVKWSDLFKDISFWDSNSLRERFYFESGDLKDAERLLKAGIKPVAGYKTEFSNLLGYYSKSEFDTLKKRYDLPGRDSIIALIDYGQDRTIKFTYPLPEKKPVYSFYLRGKYEQNQSGGYPVYGLLYIRDLVAPGGGQTSWRCVVDVKINKKGRNYFNY